MSPREGVSEVMLSLRDGLLRPRLLVSGEGSPLVYLHSFDGMNGWPPFLERLSRHFKVYAPLHPGVQGSEGLEALDDIIDLALYYDDLFEALGLPALHLVGHFFGGMVAAEIAALAPHRVRRLVLVSPIGLWLDQYPIPDVFMLPQDELNTLLWHTPDSPAAKAMTEPPPTDEAWAAAHLEQIRTLAAVGKFMWPLPDKGLKKRMHRIKAPTLILWGERDRLNPLPYSEEFACRLKGTVRVIPEAGHLLMLEKPEEFADLVMKFLTKR